MLRGIRLALAASILGVGMLAVASMAITPEAGLGYSELGEASIEVMRGSPVWRDGSRPGDRIVELRDSRAAGGWRLVTTNGRDEHVSEARAYEATHQSYLGWVLAGLVVSVVVAIAAFREVALSAVVLPLSFALVAEPLFYAGNLLDTFVGGVAIFAGSGLAVFAFGDQPIPLDLRRRKQRLRLRAAIASIGVGLAIAWTLSLAPLPIAFDLLDGLRWPVAIVCAMIGAWLVVDRGRIRSFLASDRAPAFIDVAYGGVAIALLLAAGLVLGIAPPFILAAGIVAVVIYPYWRRVALGSFDRLVTSSARRDAAIRAVEDERGRLAREIHDVPLQELAGVIRQLDAVPAAAGATSTLRDVAARLRDVATTLHPPVLQDLGLVAAITDTVLVARTRHTNPVIQAELDDLTQDERPAEDVEIAAYRIVQEALSNATVHSGAKLITVTGVVASDSVVLEVTDDGHGYSREDVRTARHAGHFGLDSMQDRALAVGATLDQASSPDGTRVTFSWARSR